MLAALRGVSFVSFGLSAAIVVACASRDHDNDAQTKALAKAPEQAEQFVFHEGVQSSFDKTFDAASAQLGLVSNAERQWSCASRTSVTLCRGRNGAGAGTILWIRYRGELMSSTNNTTPIYARISAGGQVQSFAMRPDSDSAYLLLTDSIAFCNTGGSSGIYSAGAKSTCRNAPAQVKSFMKSILEKNPADWKLNLNFGISIQASPNAPTKVQMDKGNPPYEVALPPLSPAAQDAPAEE